MAKARDLISSLIHVTSSRDVPFHQLQQPQCLHHGATFEPLCAPILSSLLRIGDNLWLACIGFIARHKYRWDTSHSYNEFDIAEIKTLWLSCIEIWDMHFTSVSSIFSVMAAWIAEVYVSCCSMLILLCNRQNIAAYEGYWFMGFPIINH